MNAPVISAERVSLRHGARAAVGTGVTGLSMASIIISSKRYLLNPHPATLGADKVAGSNAPSLLVRLCNSES
jgi:hypothetical protein